MCRPAPRPPPRRANSGTTKFQTLQPIQIPALRNQHGRRAVAWHGNREVWPKAMAFVRGSGSVTASFVSTNAFFWLKARVPQGAVAADKRWRNGPGRSVGAQAWARPEERGSPRQRAEPGIAHRAAGGIRVISCQTAGGRCVAQIQRRCAPACRWGEHLGQRTLTRHSPREPRLRDGAGHRSSSLQWAG